MLDPFLQGERIAPFLELVREIADQRFDIEPEEQGRYLADDHRARTDRRGLARPEKPVGGLGQLARWHARREGEARRRLWDAIGGPGRAEGGKRRMGSRRRTALPGLLQSVAQRADDQAADQPGIAKP